MSLKNPRRVSEPGGVLLITLGMNLDEARAAIDHHYPTASSLTLLVGPQQTALSALADEVWVYGPLGAAGFLALIRRISWRHFDVVLQPSSKVLPWLRFFIWPRPPWRRS